MSDKKELQAKEKRDVTASAEYTKPGLVFEPDTDIYEDDDAITLLADLPGVKVEDLDIDLHEDMLTITGDIKPIDNDEEEAIITEYNTGRYLRQFKLSEIIDQDGIDAKLNDGVLRLTLPKAEKAKPRKIEISTS